MHENRPIYWQCTRCALWSEKYGRKSQFVYQDIEMSINSMFKLVLMLQSLHAQGEYELVTFKETGKVFQLM